MNISINFNNFNLNRNQIRPSEIIDSCAGGERWGGRWKWRIARRKKGPPTIGIRGKGGRNASRSASAKTQIARRMHTFISRRFLLSPWLMDVADGPQLDHYADFLLPYIRPCIHMRTTRTITRLRVFFRSGLVVRFCWRGTACPRTRRSWSSFMLEEREKTREIGNLHNLRRYLKKIGFAISFSINKQILPIVFCF